MSILGPRSAIERLSAKNPFFCCVISHTATSEIAGITAAGANPDLVKYTPPADSEFLHYGYCKCIKGVPATPDGKPTPAVITKAALELAKIPFLIVEAGTMIKPDIPFVSFGVKPGGNIMQEDGTTLSDVNRAFEYGRTLGRQLGLTSDLVVVGESIPGGTTTALAVLRALGIDASFKVSSSMPTNPHSLKNTVVQAALSRASTEGSYDYNNNNNNSTDKNKSFNALRAMALVGDPMIPSAAGIAAGALDVGVQVMLAGGTQMSAVLAVMRQLDISLSNVCIGTTSYVASDKSANLTDLVRQVSPDVPVLSCDLGLEESNKSGLRAFAQGFVKEGVGAGGSSISAILKTKKNAKDIRTAIEDLYERSIESRLVAT